jgi:hypothetical protein
MTDDFDSDAANEEFLEDDFSSSHGDLVIDKDLSGPRLLWEEAGDRTEILHLDRSARLLRIYPKIPASGGTNGFTDQFSQVREIQLDLDAFPALRSLRVTESERYGPVLDALPQGFGRFLQFGLGFPRQYRAFVRLIEEHTTCTTVRFVGRDEIHGVDGQTFRVGLAQFDTFTHAVDLTKDRVSAVVRRAADTAAHNAIADLVDAPILQMPLGRLPAIRTLSRAISGDRTFDPEERIELIESLRAESRAAAEEAPAAFGRLRSDIELVSLDTLISVFEWTLGNRASSEAAWQSFFEINTFALQQLFAAPVVLFGAQQELRIQTNNNAGRRVADFILANAITRTVTVVEIKTADTQLTGRKFRGTESGETYPPSAALTGAVAQLQAQMESARTDYELILTRAGSAGALDTTIVRGAVIAGSLTELDKAQQQSFERYRNGLSGIVVITFGEVLEGLRHLRTLLSGGA